MGAARDRQMLEAGARAPDFKLENLAGGSTALASLTGGGKPVLLAFFKTTCPTCQLTLPFLDRIGRQASDQVFLISQDGVEDTRNFHKEFSISLPTLLDGADEGYPVSNAFNIAYVPSLFVVGPDGVISASGHGFSKQGLEEIGREFGAEVFRPDDKVPEWKSG